MVYIRTMNDLDVMKGHLPSVKDDIDRPRLVNLNGDLLAAGQCVVCRESVSLQEHITPVSFGHYAHATVLGKAVRQGDPGSGHVRGVKPPVSCVLMPRHIGLLPRHL